MIMYIIIHIEDEGWSKKRVGSCSRPLSTDRPVIRFGSFWVRESLGKLTSQAYFRHVLVRFPSSHFCFSRGKAWCKTDANLNFVEELVVKSSSPLLSALFHFLWKFALPSAQFTPSIPLTSLFLTRLCLFLLLSSKLYHTRQLVHHTCPPSHLLW